MRVPRDAETGERKMCILLKKSCYYDLIVLIHNNKSGDMEILDI
jgi:hypothetical protein